MKKIVATCLITLPLAVFAGSIFVEGKYQNKNLYVQNSLASSGVGYCAYQVLVNGQITTDEVNSSAFEVDLSALQITMGEKVAIEIRYKDGCAPKVLNPEALKPKATFTTKAIAIDNSGNLSWTTVGEEGSLPFVIEQFRWNKWVVVGEVNGKGIPDENQYSFKVILHSGENKFRVKQTGFTNNPKFSEPVLVSGTAPKVDYTAKGNVITFSGETMFEVYDYYGAVVKKGFGKTIDLNNLVKGGYYLCYDNIVTEFKKK
jgi:hypothetical protein